MDETTDSTAPERTVGPYRLTRSLGRGGFGEVFLGEAEDGTRAAVKLLHANWADDEDMRRRFTAEVDQARRVSGFCIAAILDADTLAEEPWIATEFIDGPTLQRAVVQNGPRRGDELQRLAVTTATALAAIHAAGVVHRDLKPDNIMLAPDGPRVIDFGIARAVEATSVTASGIVGTVGYMAPEQLEGMRLTSAVDVFSWASVMVFAATGREAFHGPTQAARIARLLSGDPDTGDLSGPLLDVVRACLDKDPRRRPDASGLFHHLVAGTSPSPVAPTRIEEAPRTPPTLQYTEMVGGAEQASQATSEPPPEPARARSEPAPPTQGAYTPPRPGSVPRGEAPPYHFAGVRFTRIEALAAAMQEHWADAVAVFGAPTERSILGSWVMNDINDNRVDRSLFRREVRDANMAVASFVVQVCPELPPRFRGHDLSAEGLGQLFRDPRPLITGGHEANELMLLARPELLRQMALHQTGDSARLRRLARDVETAERAGVAFHEELSGSLVGWRGTEGRVDPALVLTFLLHPELVVRPEPGERPGAGEWIKALWPRVELAAEAPRAGYAAAVYAALPTIVELAQQRVAWEGQRDVLRREHKALGAAVTAQQENRSRKALSAVLAAPLLLVAMILAAGAPGSGLGMLFALLALGSGAAWVVLATRHVTRHGDRSAQLAREHRLYAIPQHGRTLVDGLRTMENDLRRAREISSKLPPR